MKHLLSIEQLSRAQILEILARAQCIIDDPQSIDLANQLINRTLVNVFFENSTRTRVSFELAAKRLGLHVINISISTSSVQKGETLLDTLNTLSAMAVDYIVLRHGENTIIETIANYFTSNRYPSIINAGAGTYAHPSQALVDMLTIKQRKSQFESLSVAIIGDVKHSRVAKSQITALYQLGVRDIRIIAPSSFKPDDDSIKKLQYFEVLEEGLKNVDVISVLRIQKERISATHLPNLNDYFVNYGLDQQRLQIAKADAIVMHPGPINRNVEISAEVADGQQSVILQQVRNSIAVRMAILLQLKPE